MNDTGRFLCVGVLLAVGAGVCHAQTRHMRFQERSSPSRPLPTRVLDFRLQASRVPRASLPMRSPEPFRVTQHPRTSWSVPERRQEFSTRRSFQAVSPGALRYVSPESTSPRRRYLSSHYATMAASAHGKSLNVGASISAYSWNKKSNLHFSFGLGWPYLCGKWYGSNLAYYFSLAWWKPYYSWNYNWCAPWFYVPIVKPVYYCDYYSVPVVHTSKVVHEVVHVASDSSDYPKKYSVPAVALPEEPAEDLKKLSPSEQMQRLGDIHFRQGRYDQAAIAYERAIQENPDHAALRFILADARFAMGDFHGAAAAIRQGLDRDANLAKAKADKLAFYESREAFDKQMEALYRFANEHPANADAQLVLGFNLLFSGKAQDARQAFERAVAIDPQDRAAALFLEALKS